MTNCSLDLWIGSHLHREGALLNQRDFPLESLHTTRALVLSITLPCVTETNVSCPNQPVNFIFCIIRQLRGGHKWQVSSKEAYKELQGGLQGAPRRQVSSKMAYKELQGGLTADQRSNAMRPPCQPETN